MGWRGMFAKHVVAGGRDGISVLILTCVIPLNKKGSRDSHACEHSEKVIGAACASIEGDMDCKCCSWLL